MTRYEAITAVTQRPPVALTGGAGDALGVLVVLGLGLLLLVLLGM
ncbi:MAG: hypothetical protein U1B78_00400 [Dehalococcoidia bacterium]|nr:hypothetical protein [Dehalococcoidia bacterium]